MAHALRRILYTTCCPSDCQFAFVTRNPFRPPSELYCHLFVTRQPNEATLLNLQLCRLFQVEYCLQHRRERQSPSSAPCCPEQQSKKCSPQQALSPRDVRDRYTELDVSLNVNALVSFRLSRRDGLESLEPLGPSSEKDPSDKPGAECPFSSLTLVRKKAIRNKGIRSGAYRNSTFKRQFQQAIEDGISFSWGDEHLESWRDLSPLQHEDVLTDTVWSSTGVPREIAKRLLQHDVLGAFLLWEILSPTPSWSLLVQTPFGVITYLICRNEADEYYLEHLNTMFPSLKALIEHYTEVEDDLFCCLSNARLNHCYEPQDSAEPRDLARTTTPDREIASD
ncbi:SH2 domain-containing protein 5 [Callorhinchus milii]|nr:SH2 domain-containing protein 5 [Callorhinchus milii]